MCLKKKACLDLDTKSEYYSRNTILNKKSNGTLALNCLYTRTAGLIFIFFNIIVPINDHLCDLKPLLQ